MKPEILYAAQCFLGEGPVWHAARNSCFWVDIEKGRLYEYDWHKKTTVFVELPYRVTVALPGRNGKLILGLNNRIALYDADAKKLDWLTDIETALPQHRCNDGACDSRGRLWIGTMHLQHLQHAGALYCVNEALQVYKKVPGTTIANGIAWSPDDATLYFIDSGGQHIQAYHYDAATGDIAFDKNAVTIDAAMGTPDGMAIDAEGMLWVAQWGGFGVYRWNPHTGALLQKIELPAPNITSCAFAGEALDHLVITSAQQDLTATDLRQYPHSGDVFYVKTKVRGMPKHTCAF